MTEEKKKREPECKEDPVKQLSKRISMIETWIDQWENYESGWNKYRRNKK